MDNNRSTAWGTIDLLFSKNLMGIKRISVTLILQLCLSKLMFWNICNPSWLDILRQTSKFAFSGVDSWCNDFDVADVNNHTSK